MLKFLKEAPVYNFDHEVVRFVGLDYTGHVVCSVSKQAILACAQDEDASATELLNIFEINRQLFQDIAALEYAAGTRDSIYIDRFHVEQPAFIHHRPGPGWTDARRTGAWAAR